MFRGAFLLDMDDRVLRSAWSDMLTARSSCWEVADV